MRSNAVIFPLVGVIGLLASVAVARALSPAVFALYATAIALRGTLQFLADLGMGQAASRIFAELEATKARGQALRLYGQLAAIRAALVVALALVVLVAFDAAADLFALRSDEDYFLYFVILIGVAEVAGGLGYSVLSGTLDQATINRVMLAQGLIQPALVIGAAAAGLELPGVLAAIVIGSALRAIALNLLAIRRVRGFEQGDGGVAGLGRTYSRIATSSIAGKLAGWVHSRQVLTIVALSTSTRPEVAVFALGYDLATQIMSYAISPTSGIFLPTFSTARSEQETARIFAVASRAVALVVLPVMATALALLPVLVPSFFGDGYSGAVDFGYIFLTGIGLELILSVASAPLMLADDALLAPYRRIKVVTLLLAGLYLLALEGSLILVAALMVSVRVGSAAALQVAIARRRRFGLDLGWLARALLVAALAGGLAALLAQLIPIAAIALVVAALASLSTFALLARMLHLVHSEDVALARRFHPHAGRIVAALART